MLRSSVGVSEVMQVAPSSSTCRSDRDALLCRPRGDYIALPGSEHAPMNRLRHRRVGTRLRVAPLNLSDPIYMQDMCSTPLLPTQRDVSARRTFVTRSRDLLGSCRSLSPHTSTRWFVFAAKREASASHRLAGAARGATAFCATNPRADRQASKTPRPGSSVCSVSSVRHLTLFSAWCL